MSEYAIFIVFGAGAAFLMGVVLTLLVSEHALSTRRRSQSQRERELAELSSQIDERMSLLPVGPRRLA